MNLPLATLRRHLSVVLLKRRVGAQPDTADEEQALRFSSLEDAENYLRFWLGDGAVMSQFRTALHDSGHSGLVSHRSDHEVTRALASKLLSGALVLTEEGPEPRPMQVWWALSAAEEAPETPSRKTVIPAPKKRVVKPPPPLLPLLEEVQIEGAEVLPEVLQTLEQIDLTMGSLDLAGLSLEPAPSGVSSISASIGTTSASVTATIDGL